MFGHLDSHRHFTQHRNDALYESARRTVPRHTAIFSSTGRLSEGRAPNGYRSNHVYNSPHYKPNSSFNFWNDLTLNQATRNKWDNKSANEPTDSLHKVGEGGHR
jgi:hypothetical protein